jgi:hypothetical protein
MMTLTGIVLIVIAVALCILVLAAVPTLLAMKRSAVSVGLLSDMLHQELKPALQELKPALQELTTVLAELKSVGGEMTEHSDDMARFMSALGETGDNLHTINRTVGAVTGVLNATSVWSTGIKVAGKYLIERYLKKRGGK